MFISSVNSGSMESKMLHNFKKTLVSCKLKSSNSTFVLGVSWVLLVLNALSVHMGIMVLCAARNEVLAPKIVIR